MLYKVTGPGHRVCVCGGDESEGQSLMVHGVKEGGGGKTGES